MSAWPLARLALLAAGLLLLAVAAGFAAGSLGGSPATAPANTATASGALAAPRDVALALAALDTHAHWGRYNAPAAADTPAEPTAPPIPDAEGLARDFRLVGIERDRDGARALLLPVASAGDGAPVMALRVGDDFAQGVRVLRIEADAVVFATGDGESTLHLYEPGS